MKLPDVFVRVDDWLASVRDRLSPGQRWTAAILMAVTLAVLAFGEPTRTVTVPGPDLGGAPLSPGFPVGAVDAIDAVTPSLEGLAAVPAPADAPAQSAPPASEPGPPSPPADDDEPAALTCAADQGLPTPLFSMILALLQQAEETVVTTAAVTPPVSLAAAVATQAGCA